MLRLSLILSVLIIGLMGSSLSAQSQSCCPQPYGSAAYVAALPCPESACMRMRGCAEIGTSLKFKSVDVACNVFVLGLPATDPLTVAPDILVCDDGVTIPKLYVGLICIFTTLEDGTFKIDIPDMPELVGIDMVAQHFFVREDLQTGTSGVVLGFTIRPDVENNGCNCDD